MSLQFEDGDVVIEIDENRANDLVLYSYVLKLCSGFFRAGLSKEWIENKIAETKNVNGDAIVVKRFKLEYDEVLEDWFLVGAGFFTHTEPDPKSDTHTPDEHDPWDTARSKQTYKLVFEWMHNGTSSSVSESLLSLESTAHEDAPKRWALKICERFDYLQVSTPMLFHLGQFIHHHCDIGGSPCVFLYIGNKIKSRGLFREAFKHAVGKSSDLMEKDVAHIRDNLDIMEVLVSGIKQLKELIATTNRRLAGLRVDDKDRRSVLSQGYIKHFQEILKIWLLDYLFPIADYTSAGVASRYANLVAIREVATHYVAAPSFKSTSGYDADVFSLALTKLVWDIREILLPLFAGRTELLDKGVDGFCKGKAVTVNKEKAYFLSATPSHYPWEKQTSST